MARLTLALGVALGMALGVPACQAPAPGSTMEEPAVDRALADHGLDLTAAPLPSAVLGWQAPPPDCPHAYRLSIHYEPAQRFEPDTQSDLIVGRHPRQQPDHPPGPGPIPPGGMVPGQLFYQGLRAERVGATRDIYFTRALVGPAAPTAACMPRTWDPMDDALALGWPGLTGRLTAVGEHWNGLPVGGKCNRSACVDPKTGGGGPDNHHRTCVTPPWRERLAGLYTHQGELYAWLTSEWSDGHDPGQGIHTERHTLISVEHGRPVWSRTRVDHRFTQPAADGSMGPVIRTFTLESADACPGSLAAAGWERPPGMAERELELRDRLANADELRRSPRRPGTFGGSPGGAPGGAPAADNGMSNDPGA